MPKRALRRLGSANALVLVLNISILHQGLLLLSQTPLPKLLVCCLSFTLFSYNSLVSYLAAASSSSSPAATEIIHKAKDLVHNISLSPKSERGLIKQESDLRSELDVTINRVHYLLQYFDLLKAQHVQVLKELHVAEGTSVE